VQGLSHISNFDGTPLLIGDYQDGEWILKSPTLKYWAAIRLLSGLTVANLGANP